MVRHDDTLEHTHTQPTCIKSEALSGIWDIVGDIHLNNRGPQVIEALWQLAPDARGLAQEDLSNVVAKHQHPVQSINRDG